MGLAQVFLELAPSPGPGPGHVLGLRVALPMASEQNMEPGLPSREQQVT